MNKVRIYPYKMGSRGSRLLAEALRAEGINCLRVYPDRNYRPRRDHTLVNWGSSRQPRWNANGLINKTNDTSRSLNKLIAFQVLQEAGVPIPEFTTNMEVANEWLQAGKTVVARTLLRASGGRGIIIATNGDVLPRAPLYTQYVKKKAEYRIHVFDGEIIDAQQKKKRRGFDNVNTMVRNAENGWVYCRDGITIPDAVSDAALAAIRAFGLDFGAVDLIWNEHYNRAYVLEINTAPGLEGATVQGYVQAIQRRLSNASS